VQVAGALLGGNEYRWALTRSIYQEFLRRAPSGAEAGFGASLLQAGTTDEELKSLVLGSAEYLATQGGGTVHGFLDALCHDVLGRAVDPGAEAAFTQALATGKTRADVALAVLTSNEARQTLVGDLYRRLLQREADAAELQLGSGLLANGATDEDLTAQLVGSTEYLARVPASFATASIVWGDGTPASAGTVARGIFGGSHTYAEEGVYPVQVVVSDLDGTATVRASATVADAPLTAKPLPFAAVKKAAFTQTVATFVDANPGGKVSGFTASVVWGDGRTSSGTITALPGGGFAVAGSHRYDLRGTYAVAMHIADDGGSSANVVGTATVANKA
jgi:hypothetical protein